MSKLVVVREPAKAERIETDDRPAVGSWWWVQGHGNKPADYDKPGRKYLACVIEVGSNYAKIEGVYFHNRIALDDFHDKCEPEPNPHEFIDNKIGFHKHAVRELMGKIQQLCHQLGVPMNQALAAAESSQALAVAHGVDDVKKYKKALVKAKEKTLLELFEKVKEQHEEMAKWMKADLIPAKAELDKAKKVTDVIENKIHTVELYAGLTEELVQIREGDPASVDTRVHLMQRRHYMDEECLARYEAGGMDFKDIKAFDKWLAREENFGRIFPHVRCMVAFKIRRFDKNYEGVNLSNFIKFWNYNEANKQTYLYIRNGQQLWRLETDIEFSSELFPNQSDNELLGNHQLWIKPNEHAIESDHWQGVISDRTRNAMIDFWKMKRRELARMLWQWHRAGKPDGDWEYIVESEEAADVHYSSWTVGSRQHQRGKPSTWRFSDDGDWKRYQLLTPENIYHDDVMRKIAKTSFEHNRIAVIVQGLLDRSTCLHPHPPWRIWTPDGFAAGIELVYDVSRAITPGEAPDFEGYKKQLNKSLKVGSHTWGQLRVWKIWMEERYGEKWRYNEGHTYFGDGPRPIAVVTRLGRDGTCHFAWQRARSKAKWVRNPDKPGYLKAVWPEIAVHWSCKADDLICVDAYTPGDFHMFFDDPRTRADYIQWAPFLLSCENWHHRKATASTSKKDEDDDDED